MEMKNVIIGVLVTYVVVDVVLSMTSKKSMPSLIEKLMANLDDTNTLVVAGVGIVVGALAWYFLKRNTAEEQYHPVIHRG